MPGLLRLLVVAVWSAGLFAAAPAAAASASAAKLWPGVCKTIDKAARQLAQEESEGGIAGIISTDPVGISNGAIALGRVSERLWEVRETGGLPARRRSDDICLNHALWLAGGVTFQRALVYYLFDDMWWRDLRMLHSVEVAADVVGPIRTLIRSQPVETEDRLLRWLKYESGTASDRELQETAEAIHAGCEGVAARRAAEKPIDEQDEAVFKDAASRLRERLQGRADRSPARFKTMDDFVRKTCGW